MPDLGQRMTDSRFEDIKARLNKVYSEAAKDLQKKAAEYTKRYEAEDKRKRALKNAGKLSEEDYKKWQSGQVFIGKQWQSKVDQMARSMVGVEENAVRIVNGEQIDCFADNANFTAFQIDRDHGFSCNFSLYDEHTVTNLIADEPELLRRRYVDGERCEAWNQKVIANCITQGILQGESIPQISRRMARDTASTDMKAMTRYARTAMTCAQNAGRITSMNDAKAMGIKVRKVWLAVGDDRTRDAHIDLDGDVAEVDEPFDSILGPIMYPGDPNADDANVWNCRCALGYDYPEEKKRTEDYEDDEEEEEFEEWTEQHITTMPRGIDVGRDNGTIEPGRELPPISLRSIDTATLTDEEIAELKAEIKRIKADESKFVFNVPRKRTGYYDEEDLIVVNKKILPAVDDSSTARDRMSSRAALAHEYYGHRAFRWTSLLPGDWRDEFRASYFAAIKTPNLEPIDRQLLMRDALDRAKEAGVTIRMTDTIRRGLNGDV